MTDFSTPCTHLYTFWMTPPPFPQLRTYLINGLFLNQKTNNNIRISKSLKIKHSKKNKFFKSHTRPKIFHLMSVTFFHINGIIIVDFKSYLSQCFYVSQMLKYDGNIVVKNVFLKSCCRKTFSKPSCEA